MIIYQDILSKLSKSGYNTTRLRREHIISESVLHRIRHDEPISTETIDRICKLLGCQPGDLMAYVPDK